MLWRLNQGFSSKFHIVFEGRDDFVEDQVLNSSDAHTYRKIKIRCLWFQNIPATHAYALIVKK